MPFLLRRNIFASDSFSFNNLIEIINRYLWNIPFEQYTTLYTLCLHIIYLYTFYLLFSKQMKIVNHITKPKGFESFDSVGILLILFLQRYADNINWLRLKFIKRYKLQNEFNKNEIERRNSDLDSLIKEVFEFNLEGKIPFP